MNPPRPGRGATLALAAAVLLGLGTSLYLRFVRVEGTAIDAALADRLANAPNAPATGPVDAAVVLTVFTDYQCPACRRAHPAMLAAAHEAGDVRIVFRDFPVFGPVSQDAARIALAGARQGLYAQLHDAFMTEPRKLTPAVMRQIVEREGGDWLRILASIKQGEPTEHLRENQRDAMRLGVRGTPTYVIGRTRYLGALSEMQFARAIARARDEGE
ncbi:DsbA family protein [Qipengyuania sp.]|uniref:DsbA family protein n=1 Tax=Qipengyuania sp. TaxID=2004515 RepID=UPI003734E465